MRRPVKASVVTLVVILSVAAIALGASAKTFLSIATSTSGGTFYAVGGKLADMITKHVPDTQATAEVTAGGVENARQIKNKKTNIAMMPGDTLYNAVNGLAEFGSGKIPIDQIAALYPTPLQIVALEKSGIKTIADLKGKKVSIGAPGSSTAVRAEIVLKANGLTLNDIRVDKTTSGEASTQLLNRQIDAAFFASGAPMAAIMDVASKENIRLVPVSPEFMAKMNQDHPDLFEIVIKAGTYPKVDVPTSCVANMSMLVCRPDLNPELVYQVTKMIFEKRDDFITSHKAMANDFSLENAMSQPKLAPFHPGALRYYKEKGLAK
jgi:uncharacterized protein